MKKVFFSRSWLICLTKKKKEKKRKKETERWTLFVYVRGVEGKEFLVFVSGVYLSFKNQPRIWLKVSQRESEREREKEGRKREWEAGRVIIGSYIFLCSFELIKGTDIWARVTNLCLQNMCTGETDRQAGRSGGRSVRHWDELDLRKRDSEKKKRKERGRKGGREGGILNAGERGRTERGRTQQHAVCSPLRSHSGLVSVIR